MDWPIIILTAFFIAVFALAFILLSIFIYKDRIRPAINQWKNPKTAIEEEKQKKIIIEKEGHWIYWPLLILSVALVLAEENILSASWVCAIVFPALLICWFIIRFKNKSEQTGLRFFDIFLHPLKNLKIFLFFWFLILTYVIFIIPLLVTIYY